MSSASKETVYLNGRYVPLSEAKVPIDDRGLTFADSVYEVVRCYRGCPFRWDGHMQRLAYSTGELGIAMPDPEELARACRELLQRNSLTEASVYLQVTRGVSPRFHVAPDGLTPTVFMTARPTAGVSPERFEQGGRVVTMPDQRWERCDIKTTGLLLSTLVKREAARQGAAEAALVRNGLVTEGGSTNVFAVLGGEVRTHPAGPHILPGITRALALELARQEGLPVREEAFSPEDLARADEVFLTGTIREVFPVVAVNGEPVGAGTPGPVTRRLAAAYRQVVEEECPRGLSARV